MRQHETQIADLALNVLVVTFESSHLAEAYAREAQLHWPILVDESLVLYSAYGMERGGIWNAMGPSSWPSYTRLLLRGRRLHRPTGDVQQMGGDVLIDPEGIVCLHHVSSTPADRPSAAALLELIR